MRDAPTDLAVLAADLGINRKQLALRTKKHGLPKVKKDLKRDWVRLCGDEPRLLGKQVGYTNVSSRAIGSSQQARSGNLYVEPEAISEVEQRRMSEEAKSRGAVLRAAELAKSETRSRVTRLRAVEERARRLEIDTRPYVSVIDEQIAELERVAR